MNSAPLKTHFEIITLHGYPRRIWLQISHFMQELQLHTAENVPNKDGGGRGLKLKGFI